MLWIFSGVVYGSVLSLLMSYKAHSKLELKQNKYDLNSSLQLHHTVEITMTKIKLVNTKQSQWLSFCLSVTIFSSNSDISGEFYW